MENNLFEWLHERSNDKSYITIQIYDTVWYILSSITISPDNIEIKFEKMRPNGNKNQNALKHATMRDNGTLYFDIKKIKDAHR